MWLWKKVIIPFTKFITDTIIPLIIEWSIEILSWLIALLLWALTLGSGNLQAIHENVKTLLTEFSGFLIETMEIVFTNLNFLLLYVSEYIILTFYCYLKLIYVKAKGIVKRTKQLRESIDAYLIPFRIAYSLLIKIKRIITQWM